MNADQDEPDRKGGAASSSFAKGLSVLDFFKEGCISAHLDDIVEALQTSKATAYRYVGTLCDAGLLAPTAGGVYVLGPRIIELDRLMRISDPLLTAGSKVMHEVSAKRKLNMLLGSYFRDQIMCVDIAWPDPSFPPSFERGKPMSLFRGAMAKIILAHLSTYQLRNLALNHPEDIRAAGLGKNWAEFRTHMAQIARDGFALTRAEMVTGGGGMSAPIFDPERKVLGSITFVLPSDSWDSYDFESLRKWLLEAAERITTIIAQETDRPSIERPVQMSSLPKVSMKNAGAKATSPRTSTLKRTRGSKG